MCFYEEPAHSEEWRYRRQASSAQDEIVFDTIPDGDMNTIICVSSVPVNLLQSIGRYSQSSVLTSGFASRGVSDINLTTANAKELIIREPSYRDFP